MAPARKRSIDEVGGNITDQPPSLLRRLRNMWQFANLVQWIYLFGKAVKIPDDVDIEVEAIRSVPTPHPLISRAI
jgi:hypothetical protein